jgi:hypothetical protein
MRWYVKSNSFSKNPKMKLIYISIYFKNYLIYTSLKVLDVDISRYVGKTQSNDDIFAWDWKVTPGTASDTLSHHSQIAPKWQDTY